MSGKVEVHTGDTDAVLTLFEEIRQRFEDVRRRAFELFQNRTGEPADPAEDWLKAEREIMGWAATELTEKDGAYEAEVALPGFDARDVRVTATPTEIVVRAFHKDEKRKEEKDIVWTEFGSRDLFRRLEPPGPINAGKTTAMIEKGLLRIVAPKALATQPNKAAAAKAG